jgi:hypothetical protein
MTQPAPAFAPSTASAQAAGIRLTRHEYPEGVAGVEMSLREMARRIREGRLDPDVRGWAGQAIIAAGRPEGVFERCAAILGAVRNRTVYAPDPVGTEYVASAAATLCLRKGLCVRAGDCDDLSIALGAAVMSIGIPVRVIKQTFGAQDQEHVLIEAQREDGSWFPMDPSTDLPCGRSHPASAEFRLDPMNPSMVGLTGVPEAEFVGIGRPRAGLAPRRVGAVGHRGGLAPRVVRRGMGQTSSTTGTSTSTTSGSGSATLPTQTITGSSTASTASAAAAFTQAQSDLESQVEAVIQSGDTYLQEAAGNSTTASSGSTTTGGTWASAVQAYQSAGQAGATSVGPEIDLVGVANVTQPFTQQAWQLNTSLAAIDITSATQSDAENAQQIAYQMLDLYTQAILAGQTALDQGNPGVVPPPGPPNVGGIVLWTALAGSGAGLFWAWRKARAR